MKIEKLKEKYAEILKNYIRNRDEADLYNVSTLSKEFLREKIDPGELLAIHIEAFNELINDLEPSEIIDAYNLSSEPLLELMMGYAVAYREYIEMQEKKYEREKKLKEELKKANELQKMFISIMAHDLKNPLTIISGYSEMIEMATENDEIKDYAEKIRRNALNMGELIDNIQIYSKLRTSASTDDFKMMDVKEILSEVIDELKNKSNTKNIKIEKNYSSEQKYPVFASKFLKNAFLNVIDNAIKYSPPDSVIKLTIDEVNSSWRIGVKDEGKGIPDDMKEAVFERFVRGVKKGIEGSGLGLAIAKQAVAIHKGEIWVEDNPPHGSAFYIKIPKA
ncbi:MAG: ATP-binding protein [Candidatus Syntropharchaeia archaeon]